MTKTEPTTNLDQVRGEPQTPVCAIREKVYQKLELLYIRNESESYPGCRMTDTVDGDEQSESSEGKRGQLKQSTQPHSSGRSHYTG